MSDYPLSTGNLNIAISSVGKDMIIMGDITQVSTTTNCYWQPKLIWLLKKVILSFGNVPAAGEISHVLLNFTPQDTGNLVRLIYFYVDENTHHHNLTKEFDLNCVIPADSLYLLQTETQTAGGLISVLLIVEEFENSSTVNQGIKPLNVPCDVWNWLLGRCKT